MSNSLIDGIGNTPLVEIRRMNPHPNVRIFAKLEQANPGGSIKDRTALFMIEAGEKSGDLTPEKTVIEATSGNTGIGLAMVCAVKGYRLILAMAESASQERKTILKARGAELLLTPGRLGTDGAIEEVYRLARENPDLYFVTDQYNNPANWQAHFHTTAPEILRQTEERVTMVVATLGTSGTAMGISRRLKESHPHIQIVGVEPYLGHKIQGLKNMKESYCPEIYEKNRLDQVVHVEDDTAFETVRRLAKEEGLFVGMSSGAAMAAALDQAAKMKQGMIVAIFPDGGERYLSTPLFSVPARIGLCLFNTLTRKKEGFKPIKLSKAGIYSCGPTAHAPMHPGELRRMIFSDLIVRYLRFKGFDTHHVMNITDLDDKTIGGSETGGPKPGRPSPKAHIRQFKKDLQALNILPANAYPLAGEHVEEAVDLARRLLEKGAAYEKLRSIYFDISRFAEYGSLSKVDLNKIRLGATVDLDNYEKENPRDFTLLKRVSLSELKRGIFFKTPWGNVRPSWHIQCAAMSMKHLGDSFDIHAAGKHLIFPHHENEMAIAKAATGKPLARYWLHCDQVLIDGKKPEENERRITLQDLLDLGFTGKEVRYWLISRHYRKPISVASDRLAHELSLAKAALDRIRSFIRRLEAVTRQNSPESDQLVYDLKQGFIRAMDDDLNVPGALSVLFTTIRKANALISKGRMDEAAAGRLKTELLQMDAVLGVLPSDALLKSGQEQDPAVIRDLLEKREAARRRRDFETADAIRDQLREMGHAVSDPPVRRL